MPVFLKGYEQTTNNVLSLKMMAVKAATALGLHLQSVTLLLYNWKPM